MENEYDYEYSETIKYFDWPSEWRLDTDDEEQLKTNLEGDKSLLEFLKRRKQIGTESSSPQISESERNVRRGSIRKRQGPTG